MRPDGIPKASPVFSKNPSGSYPIVALIRVRPSPRSSKVIVPELGLPSTLSQAILWSGTWFVISASHSLTLPAIFAFQKRRFSPSWRTSSTPPLRTFVLAWMRLLAESDLPTSTVFPKRRPPCGAQNVYRLRGVQSVPVCSQLLFGGHIISFQRHWSRYRCSSGHRILQSGVGLTSRSRWGSWDKQVRAN